MQRLLALGGLALLGACASPLPPADPALAWVEPSASPGHLLMAQRLDGKRLSDGRFFQVPPGDHELQARFQFEVNGGGGQDGLSEPMQITCELQLRYAEFAAGRRYRLEARPLLFKARAWLLDEQRQVLARAQVLRCGPW
ncbi:MAG: hypothetical protein ABWY06_15935 [Pseudomonas sp.]|uniref:PA0061/PA0062 family lipoprotein n=1 Tax=Pseudomonas sp. TaxID=306 RepID=UPI00339798D2